MKTKEKIKAINKLELEDLENDFFNIIYHFKIFMNNEDMRLMLEDEN